MSEETGKVSNKTAVGLAIVAGAAGVLLGVVIADQLLGGNEAPIRVKNASIEFRIAGGDHHWQSIGSNRYRVNGPNKNQSDYYFEVAGLNCSLSGNGETVTFQHSDGKTFTLGVDANHTQVTAPSGVTLTITSTSNGSLLSYSSPNGYLRNVKVGGQECSFSSKLEFYYMLLVDY